MYKILNLCISEQMEFNNKVIKKTIIYRCKFVRIILWLGNKGQFHVAVKIIDDRTDT